MVLLYTAARVWVLSNRVHTIAETLLAFGDSSRRIFLFDTFEGQPRPDETCGATAPSTSGTASWEKIIMAPGPTFPSTRCARTWLARTTAIEPPDERY